MAEACGVENWKAVLGVGQGFVLAEELVLVVTEELEAAVKQSDLRPSRCLVGAGVDLLDRNECQAGEH